MGGIKWKKEIKQKKSRSYLALVAIRVSGSLTPGDLPLLSPKLLTQQNTIMKINVVRSRY